MSDVDALRDRLIAERLTARTAEILAAVARVEYYNRQYNASARTVPPLLPTRYIANRNPRKFYRKFCAHPPVTRLIVG